MATSDELAAHGLQAGDFATQVAVAMAILNDPAVYDATVTYGIGHIVLGSDNKTYIGQAASNKANNPTTDDGTHWKLIATGAGSAAPTVYTVGGAGAAAYQNGWISEGAAGGPSVMDLCYWKTGGIAFVMGTCNGGAKTAQTIFTLPVGYRPAKEVRINVNTGQSTSVDWGFIEADGSVTTGSAAAVTFMAFYPAV